MNIRGPQTSTFTRNVLEKLLKDNKADTGKKFFRMYQNQEQKFGGLAVAMQAIMREPRFLNNDDVWEIVTVTSEHMAELREQFKDALEDSLSTGVKNV
ncbi:hypothetical protein LTR09_002666 [Extremus antarcticus]|uniref:Uncharacterized protein n=1 Tax=Extremus antarcticus TaxID=702011 RepID=A0AAJ0GET5_9PEZI|nr:hypothetical protein LTR09_002666 [Extremus antarcticus]